VKKQTGPDGFWNRYQQLLQKDFETFSEYQNKPLPKAIRINTLKNSVREFYLWQQKNHPEWQLTPHPFGNEIFIIDREDRSIPLGKTLGHIQGRFYVQEASSFLPPIALHIAPHQKVLDMAAAPGSKTTQIAAQMQGKGLLVANEFSASRTKTLVFNLQKIGVSHSMITHFSGERFEKLLPNYFDRILLDAPCTGEGTFRKDSQALENWSINKIGSAAKLQKKLLKSAFASLAPGGILTYSTCTLAPEENEEVVEHLMTEFSDMAEVMDLSGLFVGAEKAPGLSEYEEKKFPNGKKMLRIWPHLFDSEGFFVASVQKLPLFEKEENDGKFPASHTPSPPLPFNKEGRKRFVLHCKNRPINPGSFLRRKDAISEKVRNTFAEEYGFGIDESVNLFRKNDDVWLLPKFGEEMLACVRLERPGLRLGKLISSSKSFDFQFRLSHECVIAFGADFSGKQVMELSAKQTQDFLEGKNLLQSPENSHQISKLPKTDIVLRYEGLPLGLVKNTGTILKNNLPRNFVAPSFR
jgi:16S rRNA (cytosine1407-C5)-methyltransferase